MHEELLESDKWLWGDDFFFYYSPNFTMTGGDQKNKVELTFTTVSKQKRGVIKDLDLQYFVGILTETDKDGNTKKTDYSTNPPTITNTVKTKQ